MPRKYLLNVYAAAAAAVLSQFVPPTARAQERVDPARVPVVYRVPGMERVVVREGVVFDKAPAAPLALDAYIPRGLRRGERRPAVVFVSGAERVRHWQWFVTWGRLAAAHGLVGIVPDKRYPRGFDGIRTGFEDTEKLLEYLRARGGPLGVDPESVCLWTFSAGGRLTSVGLRPGAPGVRCLVSFYGVLELSGEVAGAGAEREATLRRYSPLHALEAAAGSGAKVPPVFLARAGKDSDSINSGLDRFAAAALRLNVPLTLVNYAEGDHGFDGLNDTPQSRAVIAAALRFVREHTAPR
ncbi:MAG TPA: alpha/beta hydrolase [Pyrinomonadaceae bacterium]|nr:alpha/beta hydrolase [Pyrinomonadaceae bacterium]